MVAALLRPTTPTFHIIRKDSWIPDHIQTLVRNYSPKSDFGKFCKSLLEFLPYEQAEELIDRLQSVMVYESQLELVHYRYDGKVFDYGVVSRKVITTAGVNYLAAVFGASGNNLSTFKYHGLGTGATAEAVGDTALVTECTTALNPDSTRSSPANNTSSTNTFSSVATNTFDATAAVTEHGLFNQAATGGGTLWDRSIFSAVNVVSTDSIQTTYTGTFTAGG